MARDGSGFIQVMTTVDSRVAAGVIADTLVGKRLAGCVQIVGPIGSTYWWQGAIETAPEWLCLIKTHRELFGAVEAAVREVHPYDVPELLALPVVVGGHDYLSWLGAEIQRPIEKD